MFSLNVCMDGFISVVVYLIPLVGQIVCLNARCVCGGFSCSLSIRCLFSAKDTVYHISDDQQGVVEQQEKHGLFSWFRKDGKVLQALFGIRQLCMHGCVASLLITVTLLQKTICRKICLCCCMVVFTNGLATIEKRFTVSMALILSLMHLIF